jgi:hypothetical protein
MDVSRYILIRNTSVSTKKLRPIFERRKYHLKNFDRFSGLQFLHPCGPITQASLASRGAPLLSVHQ